MDKSLIVNRDAAFYADCIKADIEMGLDDDSDEELSPAEQKEKKKKDYQREYYQRNKQTRLQDIRNWQREHPESCQKAKKKYYAKRRHKDALPV